MNRISAFSVFACLILAVSSASAQTYHSGILNSNVYYTSDAYYSIVYGEERQTGNESGNHNDILSNQYLTFKSFIPNLSVEFGGIYQLKQDKKSSDSPRYFKVGWGALYHFLPDRQADPYVRVNTSYVKDGGALDGAQISADMGIEIKSGKRLSVFPGFTYVYDNHGGHSFSGVYTQLKVAFRAADNPDSFLSKLWFAPYATFGILPHTNLGAHIGPHKTLRLGVAVITTF
ncbi:MAG: hypothetical protein ACR2NQ_03140 [Thermodesulfobacteriota bacterium]